MGLPAAIDGVQQAEQDGVAEIVRAGRHKQARPCRQDAGKAQQEHGDGDGRKANGATNAQLPAAKRSEASYDVDWCDAWRHAVRDQAWMSAQQPAVHLGHSTFCPRLPSSAATSPPRRWWMTQAK